MSIFSKLLNNSKKQTKESPEYTSERFQGRVYGFTWAIIETRDPNYDGEQLKKESIGILMIKACAFATPKEMELFTKILDKSEEYPKSTKKDMDILYGALEGKLVIYNNLNPEIMLREENIK